jgi:hypothetical protein
MRARARLVKIILNVAFSLLAQHLFVLNDKRKTRYNKWMW